MVQVYGVMLNNELTDFDAVPGGANEVQPNKRPLSSMTPTIVLKDDKPYMTVGSPGGTTIITSVMQTILNVIGYGMELKDAIEELASTAISIRTSVGSLVFRISCASDWKAWVTRGSRVREKCG